MSSATEPAPASGSDDRGASRALDALRTLLIPGEELQSWAVQRRLFALTHRRRIVGATLTVTAYASTDLASASAGTARALVFPGLRKAEAQAVYRTCQAQEQAWREKRRVRDLEELRAKSGGIQLAGGAPGSVPGGNDAQAPAARLQRAKEMLQQGLLTDAEFEQVKSRILADL